MERPITVNLGTPQTWHDPTMVVKHGKPNRRTNHTACHARKTRAIIHSAKFPGNMASRHFLSQATVTQLARRPSNVTSQQGVLTMRRLSALCFPIFLTDPKSFTP